MLGGGRSIKGYLPLPQDWYGLVIFDADQISCFAFLGKSSREGVLVLITHNVFKFNKNNSSRDQKTWWYTCSEKASRGCTARAIVARLKWRRRVEVNTLVEVASPEQHARFHVPDQAGVLADHVMVWIKAAIDKDPTAPVGVYIILYNTVHTLLYCTNTVLYIIMIQSRCVYY